MVATGLPGHNVAVSGERQPIRFGIFEVNLETGEVRRSGVKVRMQEQPFQVLAALLEKPGEIVTKEELQERIWKDDTYVDFDRSLATAINKVRQALGDSAVRPRFIETVAKRGYRFLGGIGEIGAAAELPRNNDPLRIRLLAGALGVSLLALLAVIFLRPPAISPDRSVRRFSFSVDGLFHAEISPNGKYIAYAAAAGGRPPSLWLRSLVTETSTELAGTEDLLGFFWSPDSSALGFAVNTSFELKRISIDGGSPLTLAGLPTVGYQSFGGGSWSPDGERIVFSSGLRLYEVPSRAGSQPQLLFDAGDDPRPYFSSPHFLPVGDGPPALVYDARAIRDVTADRMLAVLNLDTGARRELVPGSGAVYSADGYLLHGYTSNRSPGLWALPFSLQTLEPVGEDLLIRADGGTVSVSIDGTMTYLDRKSPEMAMKTLVWRRRGNGEIIDRVGQPQAGLREFALSPDQRRVATTVDEPSDVWIQDLTSGVVTRLTLEPAYEYLPSWTPSGDDVSYSATSPGSPSHLMYKAADGMGEPSLLVEEDYPTTTADWSRDGRYLVFNAPSGEGTTEDIRYVELRAVGPPFQAKTFLSTPANESAAKLSPNGRFIAYVSDESGQREIYISPFPSGTGKRPVSSNGGTQPRWRADGQELFYVENQNTLMAVPVSTEQALTLGPVQRLFESADLNFRNLSWPQYDVSLDGQRFLTSAPSEDDPSPTVRIVQNWYEEFRNRER